MDARTRERYPEWVPVRTERRKPRRVGAGTRVDADGLREYAILQCVHGCGAELAMLSDGKQKIQVIEDHLAECARIGMPVDDKAVHVHIVDYQHGKRDTHRDHWGREWEVYDPTCAQ